MANSTERRRRPRRRGLMTLHEYFQTPETVVPQELIYGAVRVAESPSPIHQHTVGALFLALHQHLAKQGTGTVWLAPLDVVLDAQAPLVVQPDLFVILNRGAAVVNDRVYGAPDLVIEVLSPRPRIGDLGERVEWFRQYGVRECWLVHQLTGRIDVLGFEDRRLISQTTFTRRAHIQSAVLPGFGRNWASMVGYGSMADAEAAFLP